MGHLADLLRQPDKVQYQTAPLATIATIATLTPVSAKVSQESRESQGCNAENYARLLAAAGAEYADPDLIHRLTAADVAACDGLPDTVLQAYLRALEANAERMAGRVPAGETAAILCVRCGPVWAHPAVAAVLPKVNGWPRALGCPWCHVRKAGQYIPRPPVTCATCAHWKPDAINPAAGVGTCPDHGTHYPMQRHTCGDWWPEFLDASTRADNFGACP